MRNDNERPSHKSPPPPLPLIGNRSDRVPLFFSSCIMSIATMCIMTTEIFDYSLPLASDSSPNMSTTDYHHTILLMFKSVAIAILAKLTLAQWLTACREGLPHHHHHSDRGAVMALLCPHRSDGGQNTVVDSRRRGKVFFATAMLFFTVRCCLSRIPPLYVAIAPMLTIQWPNSSNSSSSSSSSGGGGGQITMFQVIAQYTGAMVYTWSLMLWSAAGPLSRREFLDLVMLIATANIALLLVFVTICIASKTQVDTVRTMRRQIDVFESILSQVPCIVWTTDHRGVFQWVRGSFPGRDTLTGTHVANLIPTGFKISPSLANEIETKHRRVIHEGVEEDYKFEGVNKEIWGDKRIHLSVRLRPLRDKDDNRIVGVVGAGYDVTEVMDTQRRLQHSKEKYAKLMSRISDTIICLDRDLHIRFINADSFLGRVKQSLLGRSIVDLFNGFSGEMEATLQDVLNSGDEGVTSWWYDRLSNKCFTEQEMDAKELQQRIIDGTVSSFMCCVSRIADAQEEEEEDNDDNNDSRCSESSVSISSEEPEEWTHLILSVRNMTENRRAAEQQRLAEQVLIINKSKGQFIRQLSHEIRNPLACICGSLELLELSSESLTQLQREYINDSRSAAVFLMEILNDVLDTEKIRSGKFDLHETPNCLVDVMDSIVMMQAANASHRGLELLSYLDIEIPSLLQFDRTRVSQILSNLISNAIKFTDEGNVFVSAHLIDQDDTTVHVELRCEDTGSGIREEDIAKIFQPFMQFKDNNHPSEFHGFGLGLYIVQNLLDIMGGSIDIKSKVGIGSVFSVRIPFRKVRGDDMVESPPASKLLTKSCFDTVVVATPCPRLQIILRRYLTALKVNNIVCIENLQEIIEHEDSNTRVHGMIDAVKRHTQHLKKEQQQGYFHQPCSCFRTAVVLDCPDDLVLDVADPLSALDYTGVLLLNRDSTVVNGAYDGPHRIVKKPLSLIKLMNALSSATPDVLHHRVTTDDCLGQLESLKPSIPMQMSDLNAHVMVVDDNPIVAKILVKYLNRLGCDKIIMAKNGLEAVEKVRELPPHEIACILMDIQMPVMSGFQAIEHIRAMDDPQKRDLPVVAVTANGDQETIDGCRTAGFDDLIQKPCTANRVSAVLERLISKRKSSEAKPKI